MKKSGIITLNHAKELEEMKRRISQLEELDAETEKLREMQESIGGPASPVASAGSREEIDARSIYVGNVKTQRALHYTLAHMHVRTCRE